MFIFYKGNLIRMQLLRDPNVRFAAYRLPHPLIFETHIRIETMNSKVTPTNVFTASLADLQQETELLDKAWEAAVIDFERKHAL